MNDKNRHRYLDIFTGWIEANLHINLIGKQILSFFPGQQQALNPLNHFDQVFVLIEKLNQKYKNWFCWLLDKAPVF